MYEGSYRVKEEIGDVVVKLQNLRTNKEMKLHTDRVRVIHEGHLTPQENKNVHRAYPIHESLTQHEDYITPTHVDINDDTALQLTLDEPNTTTNQVESQTVAVDEVETRQTDHTNNDQTDSDSETDAPIGRYKLRSTTTVQDLPWTQSQPLEYRSSYR